VLAVAPFACEVVRVHDGDGPLWCANGVKIRVAGIQAPDFEDAGPCRAGRAEFVCSNAQAERCRVIVERLTLHRSLTCEPFGKSYDRVVARCRFADGRDLACTIIAVGAATRWDRYWRGYKLPDCTRSVDSR
jgi:endonuclease YncB( thermonuclease family)